MCNSNQSFHVDCCVADESWITLKGWALPGGPEVLGAASAMRLGQSPQQNWRSCPGWECHKKTHYLVFLMQKGDQRRLNTKSESFLVPMSWFVCILVVHRIPLPGIWILPLRVFPDDKAKVGERRNGEKMSSYLFLWSAKDAEGFCGLHFLCSTAVNVNHDRMSIWETLLLSVI